MPDALLTLLGVGIVIFVHELGHFLMAKRAGIRVEVFSLGFGPRLVGIRRGDTDYRISIVPVGGYVKMAGEGPDEDPDAPATDTLRSKTVGQRALVMSAGVVMNLVFAFIVFPVVFHVGVPFPAPMVGAVSPGGPAWKAGLEPGDEFLAIDGEPIYEFPDITTLVALGDPEDGLDVTIRRGSAEPFTRRIVPRFSEDLGAYEIGISPLYNLAAEEDSAAAAAGLREGDEPIELDGEPIVGSTPVVARLSESPELPLRLTVRRESGPVEVTIPPKTKEAGHLLGVRFADIRVSAVRNVGDMSGLDLRSGDLVLSENGTPVESISVLLDAWRERSAPFSGAIRVRRGESETDVAYTVASRNDVDRIASALATEPFENVVRVIPGSPAEGAGIRSLDRILSVGDAPVTRFSELVAAVEKNGGARVPITYARGDVKSTVDVTPRPKLVDDRGLLLQIHQVERRYENLVEACRVGFQCSVNQVKRVVLTLKNIIGGQISPKNLGGPITIFVASYRYANVGMSRLFFFLAMLSINLAIINLLPIPVLDGGHLLFLAVEKIKGSPVNENVIGFSQWVGLVLILLLLVYVTFNDIWRQFVS